MGKPDTAAGTNEALVSLGTTANFGSLIYVGTACVALAHATCGVFTLAHGFGKR